jgi:radical SAM protein with 4Fe4S-binding SPASM domain
VVQKIDFPTSILVETTLRCPADCVFCPNKKISNRPKDMSWDLFRKIVDQCRGRGVQEFYPFINGEPLACPYLEDALAYVSTTLPGASIGIYTNGYLLDNKKTALLLKHNVQEVHFSIDGISKKVYEEHRRGLVYEKVMANVMSFLVRCQQHPKKINTRVVLTLTPGNKREVSAFRRFWKGLVDVVDVIPCDGRGGEGKLSAYTDFSMWGCFHVPYRTYILTDGSVVACCKDWAGYTILGNVAEDSLHSIWNSSDYQKLREDVSKGIFSNFEVCRRCVEDRL